MTYLNNYKHHNAGTKTLGTSRERRKYLPSVLLRSVLLLLIVQLTGCAVNRQYQADKLPTHYQAPPVENAQTIDLTKLATSTITRDLIDTGDVLEISIAAGLSAEDTSTFPARVTEQGLAQLPIVGAVSLKGLDLEEAEAVIAQTCMQKGLYTAPNVTVVMKRPKLHRITVLGAVEEPATYELRAGQADVLQAIVAAGGLSEEAGPFVQIRHPGYTQDTALPQEMIASYENSSGDIQAVSDQQVSSSQPLQVQTRGASTVRINLASAAVESPDRLKLQDGGIVMVEKRDPKPIHVIGLVRKPNRYEFPVTEELRMLDAIALAGGTDNPLADKVIVIRADPNGGEPIVINTSLRKAKRNGRFDAILAPGDVVSLEQTTSSSLFEALRLVGFGVSGRAF